MLSFAHWLSDTTISQEIQEALWIVPALQTIHILSVAIIVSSVGMINLRMLELAARSQTMKQTAAQFLPLIWTCLAVLLATGLLLIVGEPVRELYNIVFWTKMALLIIAITTTLTFQLTLRRNAAFWDERPASRGSLRVFAVASFLIWCAIMVAGRWIAYTTMQENS